MRFCADAKPAPASTGNALTRRAVLATGAAAALARPSWAAPRLTYDIAPVEVARGVWMIEGAPEYFSFENGGAIVNIAFIETPAGAVLFDTGPSKRYAEALREVISARIPQGVAAVYNTHHHPDHFFGNQVFTDKPIRALIETQALAKAHGDGFADNMYRLVGDWMRGTEPVAPTEAILGGDFEIGGRRFRSLPLKGHTEADLVIVDVETGVMVAGDLAFLDRAPTTPNADIAEWRKALDTLESLDAAAIIPGHGPLDSDGESLRQTRAYLDWLDETLAEAAENGFDMVETMQTPLPDEIAAMGAMPKEFERSVAHLFGAYERAALPRID